MRHVLIVDDDPMQLRVRQAILCNAGFAVLTATDMESALELLRTKADDIGVVVTDHSLPGGSGADLVRELRRTAPSLPVIVLSGLPDFESQYDGLNVTSRHKPYPPDQLIREVQSAVAA